MSQFILIQQPKTGSTTIRIEQFFKDFQKSIKQLADWNLNINGIRPDNGSTRVFFSENWFGDSKSDFLIFQV